MIDKSNKFVSAILHRMCVRKMCVRKNRKNNFKKLVDKRRKM